MQDKIICWVEAIIIITLAFLYGKSLGSVDFYKLYIKAITMPQYITEDQIVKQVPAIKGRSKEK